MNIKKIKRSLVLGLILATISLNLVACGEKDSEFKKEYESSGYKKLTIYKGYSAEKNEGHGYLTVESDNEGGKVIFKGFYQMKCVHIGTQDLTEAYKTNTVKEFATICGDKNYETNVSNPLFQCTSNEIFNYNDYVIYCEKLKTGGSDLYLGKKFEYTFENDTNATAMYERVMELLSGDTYDKFDYSQVKDEYGNIKSDVEIAYAILLGLNVPSGEGVAKKDVLVGETKYTYTIYAEMETYLFSIDKKCAEIYEKSKNNGNSTAPTF